MNAFESVATRVSVVSMAGNAALTVFKLFAGIFARSSAMISDAVHSASDIFSSLIVIVGVRLSGKAPDEGHPYGHERFECVAALILAAVLATVGGAIGRNAAASILTGEYINAPAPGLLALVAAVVSIAVKEGMFWYTFRNAQRIRSTALKAEAWHHRSDALSSIGALIGIAGARLGVPVLEPAASLVICAFILKAAWDIFRDAIDQMVDRSGGEDLENALRQNALKHPGVLCVDMLHTRMFGSRVYVDIEIGADRDLPLTQAHDIAEAVHAGIEAAFPQVKHIMVHVNPHDVSHDI